MDVPSGHRARQWVRRSSERSLVAALERITKRSPVIVPEYDLHPRPRFGWDGPTISEVEIALDAAVDAQRRRIATAVELLDWARSVPRNATSGPAWDNDYWGGLDALVQVAILRERDPALYLEVGSGWSTHFARRAVTDFALKTKIVSIDPHPRVDVAAVADEIITSRSEDVSRTVFERLEPGDVFLIDGSHTALMNSDATLLFLDVLPSLPTGVLVGVDDIFLPWDYPPTWEGRFYGEQYLLAAQLIGGNHRWRVDFAGWHATHDDDLMSSLDDVWPVIENHFGRHAVAFWMERTD